MRSHDGNYTPSSFLIKSAGKPALTITSEGKVIIGEGLSPDEAGRQAAEAMQHHLSALIEDAKRRSRMELIDQLTALGYGNLFDGDKVRRI